MPDAAEITRRAKSNLALALRLLPAERRADAVVFYAFCRTLDDLADAPGIPLEQRAAMLETWKQGLIHGFAQPDELQRQLLGVRDHHHIPTELLIAIIEGCQMDLQIRRYQTWDELADYIWKVACAVGLVSIRLFGCRELTAAERYAVALGHALQLVNILRDIGEDFANGGRIYLPLEDLARHGYGEADIAAGVRDERFLALMHQQAERAEDFFREADRCLPAGDRRALAPALAMAGIYRCLLGKMRRDGFRVFEKRYRLGRLQKLAILAKHMIAR